MTRLQGTRGVKSSERRAHCIGIGGGIQRASNDDPSVEEGAVGRRYGYLRTGQPKLTKVGEETVRSLHAKLGELAVANDFLSRKLRPLIGKGGPE